MSDRNRSWFGRYSKAVLHAAIMLLSSTVCMIGLTGCAGSSSIPVVERQQPPSEKINTHWVSEGETLYAIAWRYNLDAEKLAAANGLNDDFYLARGQILRLDIERALQERQRFRKKAVAKKTRSSSTSTGKRSETTTHVPAKKRMPEPAAAASWRWPTSGKVIKVFSLAGNAGHKGLDLSGNTGQAVYAAQNGVVVYAGAGLPAYGNLLIVKHSNAYLSAYAHNSRLTVGEGDSVKVGQKIAELGRSGTSHAHLHFEIRKKGVPVNPLTLLPKRRPVVAQY